MSKCEVARGHSWGLRWDGGDVNLLLASECDCFLGCSTATEQPTRGISKSFWHSISDFGPADQNASLSSPFERLRLRFIRSYWNWMSSSSVLENPGPRFPESSSEHPRFDERPQLVRCLSSSVLSLAVIIFLAHDMLVTCVHPSFHIFYCMYKTLFSTPFHTQHFHAASWVDQCNIFIYAKPRFCPHITLSYRNRWSLFSWTVSFSILVFQMMDLS